MILEGTQILCTTLHTAGMEAPYKLTHKNHPCCIWARKSLSNWLWLKNFVGELNKEKIYRYGSSHKSALIAEALPTPNIEDIGLTPFAQAMPDKYKTEDPVEAYRNYYSHEKKHFSKWTKRDTPYWMI